LGSLGQKSPGRPRQTLFTVFAQFKSLRALKIKGNRYEILAKRNSGEIRLIKSAIITLGGFKHIWPSAK